MEQNNNLGEGDILIYNPEILLKENPKDTAIIVTSSFYKEISKQILAINNF